MAVFFEDLDFEIGSGKEIFGEHKFIGRTDLDSERGKRIDGDSFLDREPKYDFSVLSPGQPSRADGGFDLEEIFGLREKLGKNEQNKTETDSIFD